MLRFRASAIEEGVEEISEAAAGRNRLFHFLQIVVDFRGFGFGFNEPIFVLWLLDFRLSPCGGFDRLRPVQSSRQKLRFRRGESSPGGGGGFRRARAGNCKISNVSEFLLVHPLLDHASSPELDGVVVLCSGGGDALFCSHGGFSVKNELAVFTLAVGFVDRTVDGVEKGGRERGIVAAETTAVLVVSIVSLKRLIPQIH